MNGKVTIDDDAAKLSKLDLELAALKTEYDLIIARVREIDARSAVIHKSIMRLTNEYWSGL